ncbi:MAG: cytochrome d ubiquinol oxidase subunit II [bacterium]
MILDYETLKLIWWGLIGTLLIVFALTDGFDMGVGTLLPLLGKTDDDRRIMLNTIGPHWEGNQVWFVTAGGALFAAWPLVYAVAFSGFYLAMMITLFALFFRPIGFDYRSKLTNTKWRSSWDWGIFIGSTIPPVIFGVAFGNLLIGIPFHFDEYMRLNYTGSFLQLLSPFSLLCGMVSLIMFVMHGATWLQMRTLEPLYSRSQKMAKNSAILLMSLFGLAGIWIIVSSKGLSIDHIPDLNTAFPPHAKLVSQQSQGWISNYSHYPWMMLAPISGFAGAILVFYASHIKRGGLAFIGSSLSISGIILTAGCSLFPFIMPSSTSFNDSLTLWDASSSYMTLKIMFWVAAFFVPLIIAYSFWTYRKMWRRLDEEFIRDNNHSSY